MRYPLIGITGPARSGKDTAADLIVAAVGGYRYAFADPLRAMLRVGLGIDLDTAYWKEHKEKPIPAFGGKSPRQMLQTLGTEWGREMVDGDLWVTLARAQLLARGPGMVVSDARFLNEALFIRRIGGKLIHIRRKAAAPIAAHKSENGIEVAPEDIVIDNDGTLEDLQASLFVALSLADV